MYRATCVALLVTNGVLYLMTGDALGIYGICASVGGLTQDWIERRLGCDKY